MKSVSVNGICKSHGQHQIVKDFNIEIEAGELIVLVGPSGCGKSTMLRMIAGLETITSGTISIEGKVVNDLPPKDRDIAMVFQNYALYPHMSVRKNLAFALELRNTSADMIEKRVKEVAGILGLESLLDRKPGQLSGGQRQRVAMGRALVRNPKVFLFDEPLSNLDAKLRNQMRAEIKQLHRQLKATMIYVTHDQTEAMTLADRVVVMKEGRIQQIGKPLDLYHRPTNQFVAGFIGSPPMNFISRDGKILGVRPEHLSIKKEGLQDPKEFSVDVDFVEMMGAETWVHGRYESQKLVAKMDGEINSDQSGRRIQLFAEARKISYFDPNTGVNL